MFSLSVLLLLLYSNTGNRDLYFIKPYVASATAPWGWSIVIYAKRYSLQLHLIVNCVCSAPLTFAAVPRFSSHGLCLSSQAVNGIIQISGTETQSKSSINTANTGLKFRDNRQHMALKTIGHVF